MKIVREEMRKLEAKRFERNSPVELMISQGEQWKSIDKNVNKYLQKR